MSVEKKNEILFFHQEDARARCIRRRSVGIITDEDFSPRALMWFRWPTDTELSTISLGLFQKAVAFFLAPRACVVENGIHATFLS